MAPSSKEHDPKGKGKATQTIAKPGCVDDTEEVPQTIPSSPAATLSSETIDFSSGDEFSDSPTKLSTKPSAPKLLRKKHLMAQVGKSEASSSSVGTLGTLPKLFATPSSLNVKQSVLVTPAKRKHVDPSSDFSTTAPKTCTQMSNKDIQQEEDNMKERSAETELRMKYLPTLKNYMMSALISVDPAYENDLPYYEKCLAESITSLANGAMIAKEEKLSLDLARSKSAMNQDPDHVEVEKKAE